MGSLENKVALITGAGQGIGRAIAEAFAREGADIVANDLPRVSVGESDGLDETVAAVEALGQRALAARAEVSDHAAVQAMFDAAAARFGHVDILVSNAAYNCRQPVLDADPQEFRRVIAVNQLGLFNVCQAAARQMVRQSQNGRPGANIVIISSVHARVALPNNAAYAMSKAAANQFCLVLANELCQHRIRVNAINPGWTDTPGERKYFTDEQLEEGGSKLPWGRLGRPDEIADAAVFLGGEAASYITGAILDVDGGFSFRLDSPGAGEPERD